MTELVEFAVIRRHFAGADAGQGVVVGMGDDAAVIEATPGRQLVLTIDSLFVETHFPMDAPGECVGHRALAVNLSDLAAMGAKPHWALLALSLPQMDEPWVAEFARGFRTLAMQHDVALIGGNLSRGPLAATVQLTGSVSQGSWLSRSGARPGDRVLVSGTLGDAAAGLRAWLGGQREPRENPLLERYLRPEPRVAVGRALLGQATAAIDISDGLLADLGHLCEASGVGARVELEKLPLSGALREAVTADEAERLALAGGDDYELLFCVGTQHVARLQRDIRHLGVPVTDIGCITEDGAVITTRDGVAVERHAPGFEHFDSRGS